MSVVHHLPPGWLLDHLSFINKVNYQLHRHQEPSCSKKKPTSSVYLDSRQMEAMSPFGAPAVGFAPDSTPVPGNEDGGGCEMITQKYVFRPELFNVTKPHITSAVHKECQQSNSHENLVSGNKQEVSVSIGKKRKRCLVFNQGELDAIEYHTKVIENGSSFSKMITLMGQKYLLPPRSSFLLSDISCMQPLLNCGKTFDVIVIDPPWENKSVKRSNRYSCLSPQQIKQMPVPKLAAADCLIVTWVTNRQKHLCFVKEELYPSWSVEVVAEWYWVKITHSGEFVFPLDSPHKKPYECLVLGRVREKAALAFRNTDTEVPPVPDQKLIVSVPCILHSHKPPLAEVLKDYIKPGGQCLELFARNLQPGWMSWGNEVLKFQHVDYFIALESGR
ncbi:N(6)-adenine-specific methyltransferase METTL4 isoform X2 [Peromyscus maniculatus bairdii]|uniref:N(6)-adenine-specific methyltransferase METTL4 isoform X2 n=1 Tax=Peromyscus maniculatus bairdii TaxID=230844 RepID=UPI001C2ECEA5|nr:N(6)-adenine-specific methyltransferase METTL4 isoform X2 [Peromyscus maniculatus bairdii]